MFSYSDISDSTWLLDCIGIALMYTTLIYEHPKVGLLSSRDKHSWLLFGQEDGLK